MMTRSNCILAAALLGLAATGAAAAPFSKQVPISAQGRVQVRNVSGKVTITTWANNTVDVQGDVDEDVVRVDVLEKPGGVDVTVVLPKDTDWGRHNDFDAELTIRIPASAEIDVNTVSADIDVSGVKGRSRLKSVSGDIRSDVASQDMDAASVSGDVELAGGAAASRVRATSVSGDIRISGLAGEAESRTTSGDNRVGVTGAKDVRVRSVSGDIEVTGSLAKDGNLEANTVSGRIKANTKIPAGFRYDVSSFSGRITNCFGGTVTVSDYGPGARLEGITGEAMANVRLKSHSGNVEVCDR